MIVMWQLYLVNISQSTYGETKCREAVVRMASQFQVPAPKSFSFRHPEEWPKWIRQFERYRLASGLDKKSTEV